MLVKYGVYTDKLKPEIVDVLHYIEDVHDAIGLEAVITSTYDGTHMQGSLHFKHLAIDLRLPSKQNFPKYADAYVRMRIQQVLGLNYDVVLEDTHIHVEYDPRP